MSKKTEIIEKRKDELQSYKKIIRSIIEENKIKRKYEVGWKGKAIDNNIAELHDLIIEINHDLKRSSLQEYSEAIEFPERNLNAPFIQTNGLNFAARIGDYSILNSVNYDINWLSIGSIQERLEISFGLKKIDELAKYLPNIIKKLRNSTIPYLSKNKSYKYSVKLIEESIELINKRSFISGNIILFSLLESLVRTLAKKVYSFQNKKSFRLASIAIDKFNSLPDVLNNGKWKNDLEYNTNSLVLEFGYVNDEVVNNAKDIIRNYYNCQRQIKQTIKKSIEIIEPAIKNETLLNDKIKSEFSAQVDKFQAFVDNSIDIQEHTTLINLKVRLNFLLRSHTENRNEVLHGTYKKFNSKWKSLVSLATVIEITDAIEQYEKLFIEKPLIKKRHI